MDTYLAKYRFERSDAAALNRLITEVKVPKEMKILHNFTIIDKPEGLCIFECSDHRAITEYAAAFRPLATFEIQPVEPVANPYVLTK